MEKLIKIQEELKAPKNQRNGFGNYNYRSCEDILEAVKPLLIREKMLMTISDQVVNIGTKNYVKATATIIDGEKQLSVSAYAREAETRKGMDDSQLTGSTSSYARKYALNGLFLIDDTKDADTNEQKNQTDKTVEEPKKDERWDKIKEMCNKLSPKKMEDGKMMASFIKEVTKSDTKNPDDIISMLTVLLEEKKLTK